MDRAFLSTKYFAISAIVALALLGFAAGAYTMAGWGREFGMDSACDAPAVSGTSLGATPGIEIESDGQRRTEAYRLNASQFARGTLELCLSVGEIHVEPAAGDELELVWTIAANHAEAVEGTLVHADLRADGDRLVVAAWESQHGSEIGWFGGDGADVLLTLRVPEIGPYDVTMDVDVGDARVSGLLVGELAATVDVGTALVRDIDLLGNATLEADTGDAILHARSVQGGRIDVLADVGNAEAQLPQRADVGYDATATTDVGDVVVRIGETEVAQSDLGTTGGTVHHRTKGFAQKPTQVTVTATSDVGDARIVTEASTERAA